MGLNPCRLFKITCWNYDVRYADNIRPQFGPQFGHIFHRCIAKLYKNILKGLPQKDSCPKLINRQIKARAIIRSFTLCICTHTLMKNTVQWFILYPVIFTEYTCNTWIKCTRRTNRGKVFISYSPSSLLAFRFCPYQFSFFLMWANFVGIQKHWVTQIVVGVLLHWNLLKTVTLSFRLQV